MNVNERAVSVLDSYDIKVLRTWKGRGAIICDTDQGLKILKEYLGPKDKILIQDELVTHIKENGFPRVDGLLKNKEGEIITHDRDRTAYIVKEHYEGKECNVKDLNECMRAVKALAALHRSMLFAECAFIEQMSVYDIVNEYEKHNREMKKIKKYVRDKGQKTDFEIYLLKYFDLFLENALEITEEVAKFNSEEFKNRIKLQGTFCHGDFHYHNIVFSGEKTAIINFEKCVLDSKIRDLYLFMRKIMEKNNWKEAVGVQLFTTYFEENPLNDEEMKQLFYRFAYPEKFWKIVNFYYNTRKAWIPGRNMEKLEKLLKQEEEKNKFLEKFLFLTS